MPMYNLIECSDNYSKTSSSLWQCYKNKPFINNNNWVNIDFLDDPDDADSASFKSRQEITGQTGNDWLKKCWSNSTIKKTN